jgi:hypothetical protein
MRVTAPLEEIQTAVSAIALGVEKRGDDAMLIMGLPG